MNDSNGKGKADPPSNLTRLFAQTQPIPIPGREPQPDTQDTDTDEITLLATLRPLTGAETILAHFLRHVYPSVIQSRWTARGTMSFAIYEPSAFHWNNSAQSLTDPATEYTWTIVERRRVTGQDRDVRSSLRFGYVAADLAKWLRDERVMSEGEYRRLTLGIETTANALHIARVEERVYRSTGGLVWAAGVSVGSG